MPAPSARSALEGESGVVGRGGCSAAAFDGEGGGLWWCYWTLFVELLATMRGRGVGDSYYGGWEFRDSKDQSVDAVLIPTPPQVASTDLHC